MKHQPAPDPTTTVQADVAGVHKLHRDFETRSRASLKKVGAHVYASDPSSEVICISFAVDDSPAQLWWSGDPVPPAWFEAAANPNWTAHAHNDAFESAIEERILHPRYGFPLIPMERHRCTQAAALALGLPAKLGLLADVLEFTHRKDAAGERLMHQMAKPRKPRKGEDPAGTYYFDEDSKLFRLGDYCVRDVEVEREADNKLPSLSDFEQKVWQLSNLINARGFHVDRPFAEAARRIAQAAAPEINDEIAAITGGAVTSIAQVARLIEWLKLQGCATRKLDRKTIEKLLGDDELAIPVRRALELRLDGAQAAVKKIDALLARAGSDDRVRGAFRYHGASTGRFAGEGFQPQNMKRPIVEDLDAAIAAVATGDYAYVKRLFPKPLSVVGDCNRQTITAAAGHELIGADLGSIESRVLAKLAGEEWKIDAYRRYDVSHDPRDEPYCVTACKIFGVPDGSFTRKSPERKVGKTCDLAFGFSGGLIAWRKFEPDKFTDEEVETFKNEWRAAHPKIVEFWYDIDRAAVRAVYKPGVAINCGPVVLESDGAFLRIELPSGRKLSYPNPRLIVDDRNKARVVFDDNAGGRFVPCRGGYGAYGGVWTENIVSGIARDILVEAMFRIEAAGYPIVLHVHDEVVCEVPIGFGSEQEFLDLMTRQPSWASDLPIAASSWSGPRYDKTDKPAPVADAILPPEHHSARNDGIANASPGVANASQGTTVMDDTTRDVRPDDDPGSQPTEADASDVITVSFTRFEARSGRLSKLYELGRDAPLAQQRAPTERGGGVVYRWPTPIGTGILPLIFQNFMPVSLHLQDLH